MLLQMSTTCDPVEPNLIVFVLAHGGISAFAHKKKVRHDRQIQMVIVRNDNAAGLIRCV